MHRLFHWIAPLVAEYGRILSVMRLRRTLVISDRGHSCKIKLNFLMVLHHRFFTQRRIILVRFIRLKRKLANQLLGDSLILVLKWLVFIGSW